MSAAAAATSTDYTAASAKDGLLPTVVPGTSMTVDVIAPSALPSGYQFSVDVDGRHVMAAVPEGGVKEGQEFRALVISADVNATLNGTTGEGGGHNIPTGHWRDGLFDCLDLGLCHAQLWLSWCCKPVALGQVLTRMHLNWAATPLNGRSPYMSAFKVMLIMFIIYNVFDMVIYYAISPFVTQEYDEATGSWIEPVDTPDWAVALGALRDILTFLYLILVVVVTMRARAHIRHKYKIAEEHCVGCEDCCCSFWCSACTVCQMARHTADYTVYNASCCSETGLEPLAPEVV